MKISSLQFMNVRLVVGSVVLGVLTLFMLENADAEAQFASVTSDASVVATINGEPILAAEYRLVMQRKTAEVFSFFKEHHNLEDHLGYWKDRTGNETPITMLRNVTLQELVEIRVCQSLAKEKGLLKDDSFAAFQDAYNKENERRRTAAAAGEIVYGPRQYREAAYYYIRHGDLLFRLKTVLAQEAEPRITDKMISEYYASNRELFGEKKEAEVTKKIVSLLSEKFAEEQLQALQKVAKVDVHESEIKNISPRIDEEPAAKS